MTDLFPVRWDFCMQPDNDGRADDSAADGAGPTRWGWTLPTRRTAQANRASALYIVRFMISAKRPSEMASAGARQPIVELAQYLLACRQFARILERIRM